MTAEIINLRRVRKHKQRLAKEAEASLNRARTGRSKRDRSLTEAELGQRETLLDGAKIVTPTSALSAPHGLMPHGMVPANEGGFTPHSAHDDDDLDPGNVS